MPMSLCAGCCCELHLLLACLLLGTKVMQVCIDFRLQACFSMVNDGILCPCVRISQLVGS